MHVELGMPERLVAVQLGHTDGGKLVRELYGHGDHGALAEIDRYLDAPTNHESQFFVQWSIALGSHVHGFGDR